MEDPKFLDLTKDMVFKSMWYRGGPLVRKYLERLVEYAIGHPIGEYTFGPNEQGILTYEQIANKVDVLLVSKDKTYKIDALMNRLDKERTSKERIQTSDNKSDIYLSNFVANFYNDLEEKKYKTAINVEQVNFNAFYCPENKLISRLDFEFVDLNYMIVKNGIKSHLLYLSRLRDLCYNQKEYIYKDFDLLLSESYEEMEKIARGNKEREAVVEFVKGLGRDGEFMTINDRKEYERIQYEIEKEEAINEATKEGLEQGKNEMIKALYENKVELDIIAKSAKISIEEVKEILNLN